MIKSFTGGIFSLHVDPSKTMDEVQDEIHDLEGIPPEQQRILFAGGQIDGRGNKTLLDLKIKSQSQLHLFARLRGGMYHETSSRSDFESLMLEEITVEVVRRDEAMGEISTEHLTVPRGLSLENFKDRVCQGERAVEGSAAEPSRKRPLKDDEVEVVEVLSSDEESERKKACLAKSVEPTA